MAESRITKVEQRVTELERCNAAALRVATTQQDVIELLQAREQRVTELERCNSAAMRTVNAQQDVIESLQARVATLEERLSDA